MHICMFRLSRVGVLRTSSSAQKAYRFRCHGCSRRRDITYQDFWRGAK